MTRYPALVAVVLLVAGAALATDRDRLAGFRRPETIPVPADGPYSERVAVLGERLFHDVRLSADDTRACASCHDPQKGWSDGLPRSMGNDGDPLARRAPPLWDLAWSGALFWDGRAKSLEDQALRPVQDPREMAQSLEALVAKLQAMPDYRRAFAAAFPEQPAIAPDTIARAIATFERTIRSGETPFDRFAAGDAGAMSEAARRGFALFTGAASCGVCHAGWQFTDHGFHDIGLPGDDLGRGAAVGDRTLDYAFKTPALRDVARRGHFMHDGRFSTLRQVIEHYRFGIVDRPSLSPALKPVHLAEGEVDDLVAFLEALTPDRRAPPPAFSTDKPAPRIDTTRVAELGLRFTPAAVRLRRGQSLALVNDDDRVHALRVYDERLDFSSGPQRPGETVSLGFPAPGTYDVICTIHPQMRLNVEVVP